MSTQRKVWIPGQGAVVLAASEHVATGGEGMLYVKGSHAYKLFLDPARAQQQGMADKVLLLSNIKHPFIVSPTDVLLDDKHQLIGYRMPAVEGEALVKTFSNIWRDETGFDDAQATELVYRMKEGVQAAHKAGALMVDGNEMNYLLAKGNQPRLIDVDSWQIGRFKPTAIMPSIRDYSSDQFSELTDWFGWGIVSFQVFTGTHPYKGTHPSFKRGDLEGRMRANASVFDPSVRLNAAVRSFDSIPAGLRDWYVRVFQQGRREAPPQRFEVLATGTSQTTLRMKTVAGGGALKHEKWWAAPGRIRHIAPNGIAFYEEQNRLAAYDLVRGVALDLMPGLDVQRVLTRDAVVVRAAGHFVWLELTNGQITAQAVFGARDPRKAYQQKVVLPTQASRLVLFENQPYALNTQTEQGLQELALSVFGDNLLVSVKAQWPLRVNSTQFFHGVAVMDCLGTPFLMVPREGEAEPIRAAALKEFRVTAALARDSALVLVYALSRVDGQTYRLWLRRQGSEMVIAHQSVIDGTELTAAVTGKGVIVTIPEDGVLTLAAPGSSTQREVSDAGVSRDMRLFSLNEGIAYVKDNIVFKLSMG